MGAGVTLSQVQALDGENATLRQSETASLTDSPSSTASLASCAKAIPEWTLASPRAGLSRMLHRRS
jgi:hypothetical protein